MMYLIENEANIHSDILKDALEGFSSKEPDVTLVTEDGDKIFTQRIILSMYSNVMHDLLAEVKSSEISSISLPVSSSSIVLNLLKVMTEGFIFSDDPDCLREVGNAAHFLGISLEGMQLGRRNPRNLSQNKTTESRVTLKVSSSTNGIISDGLKEETSLVSFEEPDISTVEQEVNHLEDGVETIIKTETNLSNIEADISNSKTSQVEEEQNRCDECDKVFNKTRSLKRHLLIHHSDVKPFTCSECGKLFTYPHQLKRHLPVHSGEKPFKCDGCEKSFRTLILMTQHRIIHSEIKPFACHCGSTFTTSGTLKRHEEKLHSVGL